MKFNLEMVIFDFDGVLVDTGMDIANATNFTLTSLGLAELPVDQIMQYIGGGAEPLLTRCLGERAIELMDQALPIFSKRYAQYYCVETVRYPGVLEMLETLHQAGLRMAIATNKREPLTHGILDKLDMKAYFPMVVGPESITKRKPDPEAVIKILQAVQIPAGRSLMVGDTAADLLAGQAAGTLTCGVTYGYGSFQEITDCKPDILIGAIGELVERLEL
jgi:2-phosphoglycolate phosphatase